MRALLLAAALVCPSVFAQPSLKVSAIAWQGLSAEEKAGIQQKHVVEVVASESLGTIIDNQGVDRSTPGTNAGAVIGGAVGGAAYVDRAINHGNYSGKTHVATILLGALLGSALDKPPQSSYQFRYAIRLGNGNVIYQDTYSSTPFRHAVGVCVFLPAVELVPEQHLCTQTSASLKSAMAIFQMPSVPVMAIEDSHRATNESQTAESPAAAVSCKLGTLAPVKTSSEKCKLINGAIIND